MNPNFEEVGKAFVTHYYQQFDANNRSALGSLYQDDSMLTFEREKMQGRDAIIDKLTNKVSFKKVTHHINNMECQPTANGGVVVSITGHLKVDDEQNALHFGQTFVLQPVANTTSFYVLNDIFSFNYG